MADGAQSFSRQEMDDLALIRPPPIHHPWVDSSLSPMYQTLWPRQSPCSDIDDYTQALQQWMPEVSVPWASTFDLSGFDARSSTAEQRRALVEGGTPMLHLLERHCVGLGVVAPSAIARGVATAVLWLVSAPCPVQFFADRHSAMQWVYGQLKDAAEQRAYSISS